ncbi:MAG TPA: hypothetical protein VEW46_21280 [Pyrinomonadaceae bacterium]|nr:hypothetical protein [Pyrinomonadaceae bacterium]
MNYRARMLTIVFCILALCVGAVAQGPAAKTRKPKVDPLAEARRTMAVSLVTSLAEESRSFRDLVLRARVQARSADVLWDTGAEGARALFRRAWDSAESADEEIARLTEEQRRSQANSRGTTVRRQQPGMRREVLRLAARHDRELGEEFLAKLDDARKREAEKAPAPENAATGTRRINPDDPPQDMAQRLSLARQLLEDGDVERALQFADPALYPVNTFGMNILDMLYDRNPDLANQRYLSLLARAANDPVADGNTISLLSSYVFMPYLYVTVNKEGNSHTRRWNDKNSPRESIPAAVRNAFFSTAATVLLGPFTEPDLSSSGRLGSFVVITRMLPLFEKHGMGQVPALRARLSMLTQEVPERMRGDDPLYTRGIVPEDPNKDRVQEALDRLPNAKTAGERDRIHFQAAMAAAGKDLDRARELAEKIEDPDTRKQLLAYLAFDAMRTAIKDKKPEDALRLARSMELTNVQRAWGLTEVGGLLAKTEPERAAEILDNATEEAKRIDQSSPDRVRSLIAIVTQFQKLDNARAWGMMGEVVKAANAFSDFSGEDGEMTLRVAFKGGGAMTNNFTIESFDLTGLFTALAQQDFNRAVDLPKGFTGESPRSVAVLAIARTVLDKKPKAEVR